jgi:hypothetical protein
MEDRTKLGAAVVGGYLLGRTKKGGLALRLASFFSGNQAGPQMLNMAKTGVTKVAASEEATALFAQIRGPLMDAAQQAALTAVTARVTKLSDRLVSSTQALNEVGTTIEGTAETATDTVGGAAEKTTGKVKGLVGKLTGGGKKDEKDTSSTDESTDSTQMPEQPEQPEQPEAQTEETSEQTPDTEQSEQTPEQTDQSEKTDETSEQTPEQSSDAEGEEAKSNG